eukprot:2103735-Rhodomonas_salina.1
MLAQYRRRRRRYLAVVPRGVLGPSPLPARHFPLWYHEPRAVQSAQYCREYWFSFLRSPPPFHPTAESNGKTNTPGTLCTAHEAYSH